MTYRTTYPNRQSAYPTGQVSHPAGKFLRPTGTFSRPTGRKMDPARQAELAGQPIYSTGQPTHPHSRSSNPARHTTDPAVEKSRMPGCSLPTGAGPQAALRTRVSGMISNGGSVLSSSHTEISGFLRITAAILVMLAMILTLLTLFGATPARGETVNIAMPDTILLPGEEMLLPVTVTSFPDDAPVYSGDFTLQSAFNPTYGAR